MNSFLGNSVLAKTLFPQIHTNMGNLGKKEIDIGQISTDWNESKIFFLSVAFYPKLSLYIQKAGCWLT